MGEGGQNHDSRYKVDKCLLDFHEINIVLYEMILDQTRNLSEYFQNRSWIVLLGNPKSDLMKNIIFALLTIILFSSCDPLSTEKKDVIRFDYSIVADSNSTIELSNTVIDIYATEELAEYKSKRDDIEEFDITSVEFRFYTFRADHPDTKLKGNASITSDQGTKFNIEMFDVGNEYKDTENHELHKLEVNGKEGNDAYSILSDEVLEVDKFTIDMSDVSGVVDSLDCDMSIYIHFRIKAPL